jgi:tetratricopeptide (TPR) repeat protein
MESGKIKPAGKVRKFLTRNRRAVIEASLVGVLLVISLVAYHMFQQRKGEEEPAPVRDRSLQEGILQYRLGSYDRARLLLESSLQTAPRAERSLALLYLGNIAFRGDEFGDALDLFLNAHSLDRDNPDTLYNAALAASRQGDWAGARDMARRALKIDADHPRARLLLGNMHFAAGRMREAERSYTGIRNILLADYNRALALVKQGEAESGALILERLVQDPDAGPALGGVSSLMLSELSSRVAPGAGAEHLAHVLKVFPNERVRYNLAALLARAGRYREAGDVLGPAYAGKGQAGAAPADSNPASAGTVDETSMRKLLGTVHYLNGSYGEALEQFDILIEKGAGGLLPVLGDINLQLGRLSRAEQQYLRAVRQAADPGALNNLVLLLIARQQYDKAVEICTRFASSYEGPEPFFLMAESYFAMGDRVKGLGAMETAEEKAGSSGHLIKIARIYSHNGFHNRAVNILAGMDGDEARLELALVYRRAGHRDRAASLLEKIRNRTPDPAAYYTASLLLAALSGHGESMALYRELMADFPYNHQAYYNCALLLLRRDLFDQAVKTARECVALCQDTTPGILAGLYTIMGAARFRMGDVEEAVKAFRAAARLDPDNELTRVNLNQVTRLVNRQSE